MSTPNSQRPLGNPHNVPWFFRLLGLYRQQYHPLPVELDFESGEMDDGIRKWWDKTLTLSGDRVRRYRIYDEMDAFGLVAAVLDLYSEEVTQPDYDKGRTVWIEGKSNTIERAAMECLRNIQVEDRVTGIARRIGKYGDAFQRNIYQTGKGVIGWQFADTRKLTRVDDKIERLVGFKHIGQTFRQKSRQVSWPWDYIHFRLLGRDESSGHGTSLLMPMFRPFRQLTLAEDATLMYRLRRAPDRNVIFVDVGNLEEHEAMAYVNAWRKRFRKYEFVDPAGGQYTKQYNPLQPLEDIFFPIRGTNTNSRIESLTGASNVGEIYDLEYFRDKFFAASKVPKAYMGFEGDINAKASLMQQDIRFARTCKRLRKALLYGIRQTLDLHLTLLPTNPESKDYDFSEPSNAYVVQMPPISYLDEWERLQLIELRYRTMDGMAGIANTMRIDPVAWTTYLLLNYAKLPEELVTRLVSNAPVEGLNFRRSWKSPEELTKVLQEQGPEGLRSVLSGGAVSRIPSTIREEILKEYGPDVLQSILYGEGASKGYFSMSKTERAQLDEAVKRSPHLQLILGAIAEFSSDDDQLLAAGRAQTDPSLLPPTVCGVAIRDDALQTNEAKELQEDLKDLTSEE